jgi:hypothetical protein
MMVEIGANLDEDESGWRSTLDRMSDAQKIDICRPCYIALDPRWLSCNVVDLARAIRDEQAFDRMPILADALIDAGCDSNQIIHHCQRPGLHLGDCWVLRDCWVLQLLLGSDSPTPTPIPTPPSDGERYPECF